MMKRSVWGETTTRDNKFAIAVSGVFALVAIAISIRIPHFDSPASPMSHVAGEVVGAVLAVLIGVMLISVSRSASQPWLRVLGIGFVIVAALDLLHAVASSPAAREGSALAEPVSDWAWIIGRTLLAACALRAVMTQPRSAPSVSGESLRIVPLLIVLGLVLGSGVAAMLSGGDQLALSAVERLSVVPGALFMAAFVLIFSRGSNAPHISTAFAIFLLMSGAVDTAFMLYSAAEFDGYFSMAHTLKLAAYGVVITGIFAESQRLYRFEAITRRELGRINDSLNEANLLLTTATNDMRALNQVGWIAGESQNIADRFDEIADIVRSRIPADRVSVVIVEPSGMTCRLEATDGLAIPGREIGTVISLTGTHYSEVIVDRLTVIVDDRNIANAIERHPKLEIDAQQGIRSWITAPILTEDEVVGALSARSTQSDVYDDRARQFVEQVASQLAGLARKTRRQMIEAAA